MSDARRTLEEIEALAAEATPGPYEISACHGGAELMLLGGPSRKYVASIRIHQVPRHMGEWEEKKRTKTAELLESLPDLLAIAQGQREEMERLRRLRDEVAKMTWPVGAAYCAALLDALNATMSEPHDIGKAIGTKK